VELTNILYLILIPCLNLFTDLPNDWLQRSLASQEIVSTKGHKCYGTFRICHTHMLSGSCNSDNPSSMHCFLIVMANLTDLLWCRLAEAQQCRVLYDNCNSCETEVSFCKSNRYIRETDSCATNI